MQTNKQAFTLIELLVVVLIIGILATVALPQYQRAVEKARLTEAVTNLRAIANAHQLYYLANGEYLGPNDMEKLDITIPGSDVQGKRVATKYFYYSPNGVGSGGVIESQLALAWRYEVVDGTIVDWYGIFIQQDEPNKITCVNALHNPSITAQKLCKELRERGTI